ncbi:MAG TPA: DUF1850 domain-containing protein [Rhodocyclaceae bacterium]|nr:DUF1850 domain-containing protein [Rhodocyclaceae bacterium]HRQ48361.1 DUF1850 domain-containing protein [Rhodocyclaceae bacterium]
MISSICVAVLAGSVLEVLPTDRVTLTWRHSVEGTHWEEDYVATGDGLELVAARIEGTGAGMEPPASAIFIDGWWRYRPDLPALRRVELANSEFVAGYSLCRVSDCRPLASIVAQGTNAALTTARCATSAASFDNGGQFSGAGHDR